LTIRPGEPVPQPGAGEKAIDVIVTLAPYGEGFEHGGAAGDDPQSGRCFPRHYTTRARRSTITATVIVCR
jgi:hypothetical protein